MNATITEKQIDYLMSLDDQYLQLSRALYNDNTTHITSEAVQRLDRIQASGVIDTYKAAIAEMRAKLPKSVPAPQVELDAGMYLVGETIYKVYRAVHGSGRMVAKQLMVQDGEASFEYRGLATRFVQAVEKMTLEQAKQFGAIYGVCVVCGATLTNEESIEAGIGPVCASRMQ